MRWLTIAGSAAALMISGGQINNPPLSSGLISSGTLVLVGGTATHTFATAYSAAPTCTSSDISALSSTKPGATASAITITGTGTDTVTYICTAANN